MWPPAGLAVKLTNWRLRGDSSKFAQGNSTLKGITMRKLLATVVLTAPLAVAPGLGAAKGCIKGAAVGGVAGHVAGHHAVAGAAVGCVIGHHRAKEKDKAAAAAKQAAPAQNGAPQSQ